MELTARYAARAKAAYEAANAANDPRDKAAWRAAAQTWEHLANPAKDTYSLEPLQRELDALKKHAAEAQDTPPLFSDLDKNAEIPPGFEKRVIAKQPIVIEF